MKRAEGLVVGLVAGIAVEAKRHNSSFRKEIKGIYKDTKKVCKKCVNKITHKKHDKKNETEEVVKEEAEVVE